MSVVVTVCLAKLRLNKKKFRPYILGSLGWLGFSTDQMLNVNNRTNATNSIMMGTFNKSVNLGFRYFIQKQVALDVRVGFNMPTKTGLGDIQTAIYDSVSTQYITQDISINPSFFSFKLGLLFCFGKSKSTSNNTYYHSSTYYPSNTNTPSYSTPKIRPATPIMRN